MASDKKSNSQDVERLPIETHALQPVATLTTGDCEEITQKPFTVWTAMGIGHSITNTAIGLIVGISSSIAFGGAPLFFYTFVIMALVALCVAITLGELASAFPHSGGQYFWVAVLGPEKHKRILSYITGILGWAGAVCTCASVCLGVPLIGFNMYMLAHPDFVYKPWMGFLAYQLANIFAFFFNLFERVLPWVSKSLLLFTGSSVIIIFVSLMAGSSNKASAKDFFVNFENTSGWPTGVAFIIGMSACNWSFSCLDAITHLVDEIPQPRKNIPQALLITVALGSFTGILIIFALFFAPVDMESVASAGTPSLQIFYQVYDRNISAALGLQSLVVVSGGAAVIGIHTWQSRIAWAFSRDGGFPFHRYLSQIAPDPFNTPIWAHIWSCTWVAVLGCLYLASTLAFNSFISAGILLQYLTYSICAGLLLWRGRKNIVPGPFWLPRFGYVANLVTIAWTLVALVFYSLPYFLPVQANEMNYVSCVLAAVIAYALVYWVFYGRKQFRLPEPNPCL